MPSGYHILKTTAYGRSADLNYKSKPSTFLAYRRATTVGGHNQLAISSIGVVLSSKVKELNVRLFPKNDNVVGIKLTLNSIVYFLF